MKAWGAGVAACPPPARSIKCPLYPEGLEIWPARQSHGCFLAVAKERLLLLVCRTECTEGAFSTFNGEHHISEGMALRMSRAWVGWCLQRIDYYGN